MYKNILIATDGSELANKAVTEGLSLAKALNATVKIVTATETMSDSEIAGQMEAGHAHAVENFIKRAEDSAHKVLSAVSSTAKDMGLTCETVHLPSRHPAEAIIASAKEKECDLIIMASHGHRGIKKILLGSVANEVITHSTIPVLVCR